MRGNTANDGSLNNGYPPVNNVNNGYPPANPNSNPFYPSPNNNYNLPYNNFMQAPQMIDINQLIATVQHLTLVTQNLEARVKELEGKNAQNASSASSTTSSSSWMTPALNVSSSTTTDVVILNVGGQRFTTSKSTLEKQRGSYFEDLFAKSPFSVEFFIDREPKCFEALLNYLRDGKFKTSDLKAVEADDLKEEFKFFKIACPASLSKQKAAVEPLPSKEEIQQVASLFSGDSVLLSESQKCKLAEWLPQRKFSLLYKATKDGFSADNFHKHCDDKGATLTIIQSKDGHIFGGYTTQTWSGNGWKTDQTTFIFTLTNPHNIPPTKYTLKPLDAKFAIMCYSFYCTVFGNGHDIQVVSLSNESNNSWIKFPGSFIDTTGRGQETFTGTSNFSTSEIEVYNVVKL